jgi:predicted aminopeptidase
MMPFFKRNRWLAGVFTALTAMLLVAGSMSGCSNLGYYWQNTQGHVAVMNAAKPVQEWLSDEAASKNLKTKLELSQRIRAFASQELKLPDNASYTRYADLKRSAVVWNVVAAPPDSLQLKNWCFAVVGCVSYRGYYSEGDARAEGERIKAEGMEVNVYGVPAYSTLGYLNWLGGDPLLSTFIGYPEGELARMIFHELAHQVLYVKDDTMFNESFASSVERLGGKMWLDKNGSEMAQKEYALLDQRRKEFRALMLRTRERLALIYKQKSSVAGIESTQIATELIVNQKQAAMQQLRDEYAQLKSNWGGTSAQYSGYDLFVAQANNASLGALAAYDDLVPQFEAVFENQGKDWQVFYEAIKAITPLPKEERRAALAKLALTKPVLAEPVTK